jgi:N-methylhydantoinase B
VAFPTFGAGGFDDRPEMAGEGGAQPYYIISDIIGGGMGGSPAGDGLSAVDTHGGNCAILSAEVMETLSPFRVVRSELIPGSGGEGRFRGGLAIRRDYELLAEKCILGAYVQQNHAWSAPWGMEGGGAGRPAGFWLNPGTTDEKPLPGKVYGLPLKKGDVLRLEAAGGGGWGAATERDSALTKEDREEGLA